MIVCPECRGDCTVYHAGTSLNPFTSTWVRDPQETVDEPCPRCGGEGVVSGPGVIVFGKRRDENEREAA